MDMRANSASMNGANSFTFALFGATEALQSKMLQQSSQSIDQIQAKGEALKAAGKGNNINISV